MKVSGKTLFRRKTKYTNNKGELNVIALLLTIPNTVCLTPTFQIGFFYGPITGDVAVDDVAPDVVITGSKINVGEQEKTPQHFGSLFAVSRKRESPGKILCP